jgi:hypothetical protein
MFKVDRSRVGNGKRTRLAVYGAERYATTVLEHHGMNPKESLLIITWTVLAGPFLLTDHFIKTPTTNWR